MGISWYHQMNVLHIQWVVKSNLKISFVHWYLLR